MKLRLRHYEHICESLWVTYVQHTSESDEAPSTVPPKLQRQTRRLWEVLVKDEVSTEAGWLLRVVSHSWVDPLGRYADALQLWPFISYNLLQMGLYIL